MKCRVRGSTVVIEYTRSAAASGRLTPHADPPRLNAMSLVNAGTSPLVPMVVGAPPGGGGSKDSRWLTLEVCREFARSRCSRSDEDCKYAHPPPHVDVQNGRVMCCFDSIKVLNTTPHH